MCGNGMLKVVRIFYWSLTSLGFTRSQLVYRGAGISLSHHYYYTGSWNDSRNVVIFAALHTLHTQYSLHRTSTCEQKLDPEYDVWKLEREKIFCSFYYLVLSTLGISEDIAFAKLRPDYGCAICTSKISDVHYSDFRLIVFFLHFQNHSNFS